MDRLLSDRQHDDRRRAADDHRADQPPVVGRLRDVDERDHHREHAAGAGPDGDDKDAGSKRPRTEGDEWDPHAAGDECPRDEAGERTDDGDRSGRVVLPEDRDQRRGDGGEREDERRRQRDPVGMAVAGRCHDATLRSDCGAGHGTVGRFRPDPRSVPRTRRRPMTPPRRRRTIDA
ncbi:MAG: hypothetical protein WKF58_18960 [Ilumatobacteraceae bacterium]